MNYIPLDGREFRLSMGLRPLDLSQWLEFGEDAKLQIQQKRELLLHSSNQVVSLEPEADAPAEELFDLLQENLRVHHGRVLVRGPKHDLIVASQNVAEDLCLMKKIDGEWRLVGACVCFPSRWSLHDKIGTSLDVIHAPVPGYAESLAIPTAKFFDRLTSDRSYWRLNWTLLDDPELFQPSPSRRDPSNDPSKWQFRVERQTLRQLPRSSAVVFTIRSYVSPASELVDLLPTFAADVYRVLKSAPDATLAYKGWRGLSEKWKTWFLTPNGSAGTLT